MNKTCSEQVFETLKERIVAGNYRANDRLLYNTIADELGVSISPVREAFLNLEKIGLVTINPRKGVYVRQISDEDNFDYSQIRFALESLAVERICEIGLSAEATNTLHEINNAFHVSLNGNGEACFESIHLDNDFHRQIIIDSQMKRLLELTEMMPLANLRALTNKKKCFLNRGEQIYETHVNIIDALTKRDAALAKSFLHQNIIDPLQEIALSSDDIADV